MSIIFILVKYLAFISFTIISGLLSYNMFSQLSEDPVEKVLLSIVAIALEALKIFTLVRANTLKKLKLIKQAVRAYIMYGALAVIAVLASYGYTLVVVDRAAAMSSGQGIALEISLKQSELEAYKKQEANAQAQVNDLTARRKALEPNYITSVDAKTGISNKKLDPAYTTSYNTLTTAITKAQDSVNTALANESSVNTDLIALQIQQTKDLTSKANTTNMFTLMARNFFNMNQGVLTMFILLTISIMIELGIISTSPVIPINRHHISHVLGEFSNDIDVDALIEEEDRKTGKKKKVEALPPPPSKVNKLLERLIFWKKPSPTPEPELPSIKVKNIRKIKLNKEAEITVGTLEEPYATAPEEFRAAISENAVAELVQVAQVANAEIAALEAVPEVLEELEAFPEPMPNAVPAQDVETLDPPMVWKGVEDLPPAEPVVALAPEPEKPAAPIRKKAAPKKPVVAPVVVEELHPKVVKPVRSLNPTEVGETRAYRFGKTTPEVRTMFEKFVRAIFNNNGIDALIEPKEAAIAAGIKPGLAPVFISRLTDLKGNTGLTLVELREDPETNEKQYFPNYAMEYIISYATQEMNTVAKGKA
jgi:hypothetical protein